MHQNIPQTIISLKDKDLTFRNQLIKNGQLEDGYHPEMEAIHNENAKILEDIIDRIGYPTIERVGKEASEAAWLVIQHAISQPAFMKKCLVLLEAAVKEKNANPKNLAYLSDRIAIYKGKPQKYGTQFDWDDDGLMSPYKYDDLLTVNLRRKSIGLNTLEEQIEIMRRQVEGQKPPRDLVGKKIEFEKWRKRVGWVK